MWQFPCYWCCACRAGVLAQAIQHCAWPGSSVPVGWAQVERVAQFRARIDELEAQLARVRILELSYTHCVGKGDWFAGVRILRGLCRHLKLACVCACCNRSYALQTTADMGLSHCMSRSVLRAQYCASDGTSDAKICG